MGCGASSGSSIEECRQVELGPDVFISYRVPECQKEAKQLDGALKERGLRCHLSTNQFEDLLLSGGDNWASHIFSAIDACTVFVVMGSATYGQQAATPRGELLATWEEINYAKRNYKPIFLIKLCGHFALPDVEALLSGCRHTRVWDPRENLDTAVVEDLVQLLQGNSPSRERTPPVPPLPLADIKASGQADRSDAWINSDFHLITSKSLQSIAQPGTDESLKSAASTPTAADGVEEVEEIVEKWWGKKWWILPKEEILTERTRLRKLHQEKARQREEEEALKRAEDVDFMTICLMELYNESI
eukprot:gene21762-26176_t